MVLVVVVVVIIMMMIMIVTTTIIRMFLLLLLAVGVAPGLRGLERCSLLERSQLGLEPRELWTVQRPSW